MFKTKNNLKKRLFKRLLPIVIITGALTGCARNEPRSDADGSEFGKKAFEYFLELSKIPRCSNNERAISDWLSAFGRARGFETVQDEAFNVLIKKPGSKGRENEPAVILQAHMDMVCEKNEEIAHDFAKDPIIPVIDGDWIRASGTTLGADDGAGIAMILALLDSDLSHPPIEAIITTDEEDGMTGAAAFDAALLTGTRLINVDGEGEGVFFASSAASADVDVVVPMETQPLPRGVVSYTLSVKGLTGGHSGVDIHKGLANANILMARTLADLRDVDYRLSNIAGGSARNAIPRECAAVISFAPEIYDAVKAMVAKAESAYKAEYLSDAGLTVTLEQTQPPQNAMAANSKSTVLDAILRMPNGVLSMSSDIDGLVRTSSNLGVIVTSGDAVTLSCLPRSSEPSEQSGTIAAMRELADSIGARIKVGNENPAWPYKPKSPLRDEMIAVFMKMFGKEPSVEAIHAGLECGIFAKKIPGIDMISIGPTIQGAHSPTEKMSLSSFYRVSDFLVNVLKQITEGEE